MKKFLALSTASLLTVALLTACGSDTPETESTAVASSTQQTVEEVEETATADSTSESAQSESTSAETDSTESDSSELSLEDNAQYVGEYLFEQEIGNSTAYMEIILLEDGVCSMSYGQDGTPADELPESSCRWRAEDLSFYYLSDVSEEGISYEQFGEFSDDGQQLTIDLDADTGPIVLERQ